jgi:hypothetical protein
MGLLVASSFAAAQDATPSGTQVPTPASAAAQPSLVPNDFLFGDASISLLGTNIVDSSKFQEYRDLSRGIWGPQFSVTGAKPFVDFTLYGQNIGQRDQRYFGDATFPWVAIKADFNQTPHNMGNNGQTMLSETAPGVYSMSPTLRKAIGGTNDAKLPTTARTYDFYASLLGPSFATTNSIDITSERQRGNLEVDLGQKLPFDLAFTYMREHKSGYRGLGGGDILGAASPVVEVPEPLDENVQDFGLRAAYAFKTGNVHASFNRNLYDNHVEALIVDNPFQAADVVYTAAKGATPALGGPGSVMFVNAPDNQASTGRFGVQLKFKRQTRVTGDVGIARWTQNAPFYPYTINSTVLTGNNQPANSVSSLQQPSLNGKVDTTTLNFAFLSRPVKGLGIRMRYRSYDLSNKTVKWLSTGDLSGSPDRSWGSAPAATAEDPFGYATANPYSSKTQGFTASATYDIKNLTVEGVGRTASLSRTYREATSGKENGGAVSALYHASEWLGIRATVDVSKRTAKGETTLGFQADEAERKMTRTGVDIELTPIEMLSVSFGYFRRNVDYPNRPDCITGAAGTPCGLLGQQYDSYDTSVDFTPNARAEFGAYFTWEKDSQTNAFGRTVATNMITFIGSDKTNSFGANALFHIVPEKWTFTLMARHQRVDGLMDVLANPANTFYINRASVGGPQPITDWDDTKLTTGVAQLEYAFSKIWSVSVGYAHESYSFGDAFTSGIDLMPQSVLIFMKPDRGGYHANLGFATLNYRF